jgi:CRP-like cAMP-binding protein
LFTEERTATIAATEECVLWMLDRRSFQRVLRDALLRRRDLAPTVYHRLSSSEPV